MMEVTLNKSWHLWIANFAGRRIYPECGTDICEYTRAFLAGMFWFLFVAVVSTLIGTFVLGSLWNILAFMFGYHENIHPYTFIFILLVGSLLTLALFMHVKEWYQNRPTKEKPKAPPTFAAVAYRKFKDKTCFRINFNE